MCYDSKMFQIHQVLRVPSWMAKFFSWTLEPVFSSSEPAGEARVGMGATVDIQRQQRMELLDQQLMLSQFAQVRRQRQQQVGSPDGLHGSCPQWAQGASLPRVIEAP